MDLLPNELIEATLQLLEPADLDTCSRVSWSWRHTSRRLLGFEWPEPVDCLGGRIDGMPRMQTFLSRAAYKNRGDIIGWARAKGYPWDDEVCPAAAYGGHAALLRDLHGGTRCSRYLRGSTHCPCSLDDCLVAAAAGGHLDLVKSLMADIEGDKTRPTEADNRRLQWWERLPVRDFSEACRRALVAAVAAGHVDVAHTLKRRACYWNDHVRDVLSIHIMQNRMTTLSLPCNDTAALIAAERGDLFFVSRLWSGLDRQHRRATLLIAALHKHVDLVRWIQSTEARSYDDAKARLIDLIISLDSNSDATDKTPDAPTASLALDALPSWSRDLAVAAAYAGHLGVLAWLKGHGVRIRRICTLAAAYNGHTHVLAWARDQGVRFSGLVTSVAAARGHRECAKFCERECGVPLLWEYNKPTWHRPWYEPFGCFAFGRRRHVAEMASAYGCAASAVRLAQRCAETLTPRVFKSIWLAGDRRVILALAGQVQWLWLDLTEAAATKCQIDVLYALGMGKDSVDHWCAQRIFLAPTRSRYGWRNVFAWLADRGYRCDDCNMYNMISRYSGPYAEEAFVWAVDRWCPWPRTNRYMLRNIRSGSRVTEWVLMSDEDPLVVRDRAAAAARSPSRK
ncbi:F-box domain containing protein [Pandoravirus salinus]|uniref:F-box domain containing protein n=1 Tax=Pandoravirus salinus TaxID=1349410 RepID=S4VXZ6_9VIRU|nr:F-box domain [Pandoravirus salinus]AGO84336.1 F-box domain containing protein [Pandoravirus salinus]